jgi:hypothetical protein
MKHHSYTYIKTFLVLLIFVGLILSMSIFPLMSPVGAAPMESDANTFVYYKSKIQSSLQDLEREFRLNNVATDGTLANVKNLVQEAYIRLPDSGEVGTKNE